MGKDVPQVAVFDTAFHQTMPAKAFTYAVPYNYYKNDGIRRYGFHGTSHRYVSGRCAELMGKPSRSSSSSAATWATVPSICAIDGGKSVDTSMGFTPWSACRWVPCGDLDPGVMQFIMNKYGMDIDEMLGVPNKKSGVLGVSGVSSDFRDLGDRRGRGQ